MSLYQLKGTSGSVINQSFPFQDTLLLGSSEQCDVRLAEPGVAPRHAEISVVEGKRLLLRNLDPGFETLLNGVPVDQQALGSGDEIRVGSCRWMLQAPGLRPERLLTAEAVKPSRVRWLRIFVWTTLAAAVAAMLVTCYLLDCLWI